MALLRGSGAGSKLPISLHYLAQGEGQGGGLRSVPLIRYPPHTPIHYNTSFHWKGWDLKLMYIKLPMWAPPPHPLQYQWSLEGVGPETRVHKITNVPVFLYTCKLNDFDAGKSITQVIGGGVVLYIYVLCGLVCLLDCTLYIIFVVIHPTEYI